MADVLDAVDAETGRRVAVKVLRSIEPDHLQRFERELDALKSLDHPAVVALLGHGEHKGRPFLVLERCDGGSLASVLEDGPLGPDRARELGAALAAGLAHAHERGVVHRDVKPANVLLCEDGTAKLGDFGIARITDAAALTGTGFTVGTAAYLAPEQARGEAVGPPADVYSLGLVVLEAATGDRAFGGTGMAAAVARLQHGPDIPDDLPSGLATTVGAMTAMNPDDRPTAATAATRLRGSSGRDAVDEGTAVLPLLADPTSVLPAVPAGAAGATRGGFWGRVATLPRWAVPFACFLLGFLAVLALGLAVAGDDGGDATTTTTATTVPTTTATTAPPTTAPAPPPDDDDEDDGPRGGGGRGNGNGNGRGGGGGDD
jgi:serine/threonine protein kinase